MALLAGDAIQSLFGSVLGSVLYENARLESWAKSSVRDPATGTFPYALSAQADCKVQMDACTEAQRGQDGYAVGDVRFMVLQSDLPTQVNTDSRIAYRGQTYLVMSVEQDPARVYWDCRARLAP